jgi:hypothetical protein
MPPAAGRGGCDPVTLAAPNHGPLENPVHRPTFRRARRSLALGVAMAAALALVGPLAQAGAAGGNEESFATLKVTAESVSLKAKGEDDFKPAADGDQLRAGDTVRTDATGKAEIEYGDDAYTRLDSDTTFKITKLSDDEGNRQVEGTIESGKTWNRTAALTESESFEQTGADATAAVEGTAFAIECESVDHCVFTGVVDDVSLTGADGVKKLLNPLDECDSSSGILCGDITQISADDLPQWILDNLILDVARGYPFPFGGTVVVENGSVFFVPDNPPAPPSPGVSIQNPDVDPSIAQPWEAARPADEIWSEDESSSGVWFKLPIDNPGGAPLTLVFIAVPDPNFGVLQVEVAPSTWSSIAALDEFQNFDPGTTTFRFVPVQVEPGCGVTPGTCFDIYPTPVTQGTGALAGSIFWSDTFTVEVSSGASSDQESFTLKAVDDICTTDDEPDRVGARAELGCPSYPDTLP